MKFPESWLREWTDPALDTEALAHRLTMAGHEVEGIETDGEGLDAIVIAEVLEVGKHPGADKLSLCKVSHGDGSVFDPLNPIRRPENYSLQFACRQAVAGIKLCRCR